MPEPLTMTPCLSLYQPWAWLIAHGHKDVENRPRIAKTLFNRWVMIHATAYKGPAYHAEVQAFLDRRELGIKLPPPEELDHGGIVGRMFITGAVTLSGSIWWMGPKAYTISKAEPVDFMPCRGGQGVFYTDKFSPVPPPALSMTATRCAHCLDWAERHPREEPLLPHLHPDCTCV